MDWWALAVVQGTSGVVPPGAPSLSGLPRATFAILMAGGALTCEDGCGLAVWGD